MKKRSIIATTFSGLEEVLAGEIEALGGEEIQIKRRAVEFVGDKKLIYTCNLALRTALRILVPIYHFRARHESALYNRVMEINWSDLMDVDGTFAVDSVVNSRFFTHSKYAALKTKDAIADWFVDRYRRRPNVNVLEPQLQVHLHIYEDNVTVLLDSSGHSLHKRGYRTESFKAPINEVLAAGMILLTGWDGEKDFYDPMCGAGTIPLEAAKIATNTAPCIDREYFCFKYWKDFDEALLEKVIAELKAKEKMPKVDIVGSDIAFQALRIAERNAERSKVGDIVRFERKDFFKKVVNESGIVIMNPPYDERIKNEDIVDFYKSIGDYSKHNMKNHDIWIISSNLEALKHFGLKPARKIPLFNGPLECRFNKYEIF